MKCLPIVKGMLVALAGAVLVCGAPVRAQTTSPPPQPPAKRKKGQIDTSETAGVRGAGSAVLVRVTLKGRAAEGAYVVARNRDGSVAGTCNTDASGSCSLELGADRYNVTATLNGMSGAASASVPGASSADGAAGSAVVAIKLGKQAK